MRAILLAVLFAILLPVTLHAQEQDIPVLPTRNVRGDVIGLPTAPSVSLTQRTSEAGIAFIKELEQFRAHAYADSGGGYTIGYGVQTWNGRRVTSRYPYRVTEAQADAELRRQLDTYETIVRAAFMGQQVEQSVFDALVSVAFNLGRINSSILVKLRTGRAVCVSDFVSTAKARGQFSSTLYARRIREFVLFLGEYERALEMELESVKQVQIAYRSLLRRATYIKRNAS